MLLLTVFLAVLTFQFSVFLMASFPLMVITQRLSSNNSKSDNLLTAKIDTNTSFLTACYASDNCGMCANATEKGGIIESPHFPNEYGHNLNCLYRIKAPLRKKIKLTFTEFRVKTCCDYVSVFDKAADPLKVGFNGNIIPPDISSSSNEMMIKFTSTLDNTLYDSPNAVPARWQAEYTFI